MRKRYIMPAAWDGKSFWGVAHSVRQLYENRANLLRVSRLPARIPQQDVNQS